MYPLISGLLGEGMVRYDVTRCCAGTHNSSLSAIPTEKAIFRWNRSTSCHVCYLGYLGICCQASRLQSLHAHPGVAVAETVSHGLSWPRLAALLIIHCNWLCL